MCKGKVESAKESNMNETPNFVIILNVIIVPCQHKHCANLMKK